MWWELSNGSADGILTITAANEHPPLVGWSACFWLSTAWLALCTGTAAEAARADYWRSSSAQPGWWGDPAQRGPPPAGCPADWDVEAYANWWERRVCINIQVHYGCISHTLFLQIQMSSSQFRPRIMNRCQISGALGYKIPSNLWRKSLNLVVVQIEHNEVV